MQITETRLREIIQEEIVNHAISHVKPVLIGTMNAAKRFVSSVEKGNRDANAADELKDSLEDLKMVVQLFRKNRIPESGLIARFHRYASELADMTGFWKTPTFLGKTAHKESLDSILQKMNEIMKQFFTTSQHLTDGA